MSLFPDADHPDVAEAERILREHLDDDVIDEVVNRPADSLSGGTLRDLAVTDPEQLLVVVRSLFDQPRP